MHDQPAIAAPTPRARGPIGLGLALMLAMLPAGTASCAAPPEGIIDRDRLTLAFSDEFDGPLSIWSKDRNPGGRWKTNYFFGIQDSADAKGWESRTLVPNEEMQYYADPADGFAPFEQKDGMLSIIARPNPSKTDRRTNALPYISGLISTEKSFARTTGYFEARVALPAGKGLWPAFWLLPAPTDKGGWAQSTGEQEIDIFESIGEPGAVHFTVFNDGKNKSARTTTSFDTGADLSQFHTYGVLLTEREISWYFDDREVWRQPNRDFRRPAYMLLNLAVGGKWPGAPDPQTRFPARMTIDWVRAYEVRQ